MAKLKRAVSGRLGEAALTGGASAALLNILILLLTRGAGIEPMARVGGMMFPEPILVSQVAIACFIAAIGASAVLYLLRQWTRDSTRLFYKIAMIVLILSMSVPAMAPVNRLATRFIIGIMYLVAAGAIIGSLQRNGGLKK